MLSAAHGMAYLETKNILHLDLSARNLLVTKVDDKYESKVADFGLSRVLQESNEVEGPIPVSWSAPEVLTHCKDISSKCDVWSFGVTMWEVAFFRLGFNEISNMINCSVFETKFRVYQSIVLEILLKVIVFC